MYCLGQLVRAARGARAAGIPREASRHLFGVHAFAKQAYAFRVPAAAALEMEVVQLAFIIDIEIDFLGADS